MKGVDAQTLGAFRQAALALTEQLRSPVARGGGKLSAGETSAALLTHSQIREVAVLAEQILTAYRKQRQAAERLVAELKSAEAMVERYIQQPNFALMPLLEDVLQPSLGPRR